VCVCVNAYIERERESELFVCDMKEGKRREACVCVWMGVCVRVDVCACVFVCVYVCACVCVNGTYIVCSSPHLCVRM